MQIRAGRNIKIKTRFEKQVQFHLRKTFIDFRITNLIYFMKDPNFMFYPKYR